MASATADTAAPNKVKISDAGPSLKKLHIEIPADVVSGKIKESMDVLAKEAALPGFRPGKAPRALIEKRFGKNVRSDAKGQLVSQAYTKAVEEHKLRVIGEPTSEMLPKAEIEEGKPFAFEVEVEVMPEFELPKLDGVEVIRPLIDVTDEMVEKEITNLKINEGELESRDKAIAGDYLTGHAVMKDDKGTEFYNIQGAVVQSPTKDKNGKGMILGIVVDDFSKQLGEPKAADTVTIKVKGPAQHEVEGIRNADLTVTFKIDRIDRIIQADIEKVLAATGFPSEAELRDRVRDRLKQNAMVQQQTAMRQQLAKHLLDTTKMDLPQRLTAAQASRTLERRRMELMYRGVKPAEIEEHIAELRNASNAVTVRDLKLQFLLAKAAEDLKVQVTEADVNNAIVRMAMERGERPDKLRQQIIQSNQGNFVVSQVRDHKTMDAILAKAKVSEMPAEEFNKKMAGKTDNV